MRDTREDSAPRPVQILDGDVINKIAAGEVVERPASVVKELVENALDAGARRVEIEAEDGGRHVIRITDDGRGMGPEDAQLALQRHATSKIVQAEELAQIASYGFRGEALPSIASVSRFRLSTRARGDDAGTRLDLEGGGEARQQTIGCPEGTVVEVRDLFFNTPARRKFLKARSTELAHISDVVTQLALPAPEVGFRYRHDGRELLRVEGGIPMLDRVRKIYGSRYGRQLFEREGIEGVHRVWAFLAPPMLHVGTPRYMSFFVNGRAVRDRTLSHGALQAYRQLMPPGRFPVAVIFIEMPQELVDVNVHPQKAEVRFAGPGAVHQAIFHVVEAFLADAPWVAGELELPELPRKGGTPIAPRPSEPLLQHAYPAAAPDPEAAPVEAPLRLPPVSYEAPTGKADTWSRPRQAPPMPPVAEDGGHYGQLVYIGQLHAMYLLCQSRERLVVIDQHAAHERLNFEELREAYRSGEPASQALLIPQSLELTEAEAAFVAEQHETFARLGFHIEPFGPQAIAIKAAPAILGSVDCRQLLLEVIHECMEGGRPRSAEAAVEDVLATMACHASVRGEHPMSPEEARALLERMDGVDFSANCPHGRPVVVELSRSEIERWFHRR